MRFISRPLPGVRAGNLPRHEGAIMLAARLAYVTAVVRDVETAATVFERDVGGRRMAASGSRWAQRGLCASGDPWALGFFGAV